MAEAAEGVAARRTAWTAVRRVHEHEAWSVPSVRTALGRSGLDARDRSFAANLAYETLRWEGTLDWALQQVVERPLPDVEPSVLDILRMGAWQLLYGAAPDQAAVSTSVDLAREVVGARATGFVNGALRGLARRKDRLPWPSEGTDEGLGLRLGYPAWIVADARRTFGERASAVLAAGNRSPGVTLRVVRGTRPALIEELRGEGIEAEPGVHSPDAIRAPGADPAALRCVIEGRATPQDESSMLVAEALLAGCQDGVVVDLCAAPGGKSTHLAQAGLHVVSLDKSETRAGLVERAAKRLGLVLSAAVADGTRPPIRHGSVDAALVDAPCTGLGVVRRRPELRWRRSPTDAARLGALQIELLGEAARLVRPGGHLVYSACTWTRSETTEVRDAFLAAWGHRWQPTGPPHGLQLDPDEHGTDGMYVAVFTRRLGD